MRRVTFGIFGLVTLALCMVVLQGQQLTPPGEFWSAEKIAAELQKPTDNPAGGHSIRMYEQGELVMRTRHEKYPNNKSIHPDIDEFLLIMGGSGTFMTGGVYDNEKDRAAGIHGGEAHDLKAGDFVMIPAGTLHGFTKINGSVTMFEGRYPARNALNEAQRTKEGQQKMTPPGIYWSKANIDTALQLVPVHVGGGNTKELYAPGEVKLRRRFASDPNNKSIHPDIDEFLLVTAGSGTFMTGGAYDDEKNHAGGIRGGEAHDVKAGDFVLIPAGTLHGFMKINGSVTMLEGRYPPAKK